MITLAVPGVRVASANEVYMFFPGPVMFGAPGLGDVPVPGQ